MSGNRMRWQTGRRGHYEGWFVAFNNPAEEAGYWIRYSMVAPTDESREPIAQAWFMRTDRGASPRHRALRTTFPIDRMVTTSRPFSVEMAGNRLGEGGCSGTLSDSAGPVTWNLQFEALLPGITPTPEWGARIATCFQEPRPLIRVSGEISENGRSRPIDGWLGEQAHVFGARHSDRWHWAECKHLGAGRAFTGVAAWPRVPPRTITSLSLVGASPEMRRTRTLDLFRPVTTHSPDGWEFDAEYARERLWGRVTPRREDLIGVTYHDPSGRSVYCYHSELADLSLRYYRRTSGKSAWNLEEEISAPGASAFEYGATTPLADVALLL
ncbi:MAG: hypothetical protein M3010_03810 [Candidatus Dormibacteraeota bacterium]|nr:hypothetical protein [Candidatus Dormibacteraeota bacterium]